MREIAHRTAAWIEARGGGLERARAFLSKPLPRNISWLHTLGALLLVYLLFQVLTGILLGLYYSPSPENAYSSMRYVREELFLGSFLYKLHRWGAGFVMVTAFLHFARSYFLGAYRSPRELLWISGLFLGVLLTLFAFTGQLLPYDQHGYWATVVGIQIASSVPLVGDRLHDLLTGGFGDIGAVTLSRFFILHVCVLPLLFGGLLALHLAILQRLGSAGPRSGSPDPRHAFYPRQAMKDVLVSAAGALTLFVVAALAAHTDSGPANPQAGDFVPRPEWYFLAHYELLKILPGSLWLLGTFIIPNALLGILLLLPFIDRAPFRGPKARRLQPVAGGIACALLVGLTALGIADAPTSARAATGSRDPVARGKQLFHDKKCINCHAVAGEGGVKGPALDRVGSRLREDYMREWIRRPEAIRPGTEMPAFDGTEEELDAIVNHLMTLE